MGRGRLPGLVRDRLHFDAPPMRYALIREVVRNEFGKDPEELFLSFEKEAFAAASLGQVHRARLKSGETFKIVPRSFFKSYCDWPVALSMR